MNANLNEENLEYLFKAVTTLETVEDCRKFFEDLCTIPEMRAMSQRLMVAKMLSEKTVYSKIVAETGASTATISRVNRSLNYTSCDGYSLVFERLKALEEKENGGE
ncbi:MAG: TrpR-like protein, YerC/YecD [Clostridia bacterium]|nr:TrpR-like protein, YerC/YecD [Clostridia bacterium]